MLTTTRNITKLTTTRNITKLTTTNNITKLTTTRNITNQTLFKRSILLHYNIVFSVKMEVKTQS